MPTCIQTRTLPIYITCYILHMLGSNSVVQSLAKITIAVNWIYTTCTSSDILTGCLILFTQTSVRSPDNHYLQEKPDLELEDHDQHQTTSTSLPWPWVWTVLSLHVFLFTLAVQELFKNIVSCSLLKNVAASQTFKRTCTHQITNKTDITYKLVSYLQA